MFFFARSNRLLVKAFLLFTGLAGACAHYDSFVVPVVPYRKQTMLVLKNVPCAMRTFFNTIERRFIIRCAILKLRGRSGGVKDVMDRVVLT